MTDRLTDAVLAHVRRGGNVVWMMTEPSVVKGAPFLPASGEAVGTLIKQSGELGNFPNDEFCDLQFFNVLDGASPISFDAWPAQLIPLIGAIRTKSSFLSSQKDLSRAGYIVEVNARAQDAKLHVGQVHLGLDQQEQREDSLAIRVVEQKDEL